MKFDVNLTYIPTVSSVDYCEKILNISQAYKVKQKLLCAMVNYCTDSVIVKNPRCKQANF